MRSRYAEDALAKAVARRVHQYVLLGAGLDTFAHRNPYAHPEVFEIDHPSAQRWKRELLAESQLSAPDNLHYVPVDFERESLAARLKQSGLDPAAPTMFAWLGVVMYLTYAAFCATLNLIAGFPSGSAVVLDYETASTIGAGNGADQARPGGCAFKEDG
jgi:methyltransferase (TIGR00027 family)